MSLPPLNATQEAQILEVLFKSTTSSVVPMVLLEGFLIGSLCACIPLGTYIIWIKSVTVARAPTLSTLWIIFAAIITHWALAVRQLNSTLAGRSVGISLSSGDLWDAIDRAEESVNYNESAPLSDTIIIAQSYEDYGTAFEYLFPLVTETVLLGFASALFAIMAYTTFWQSCSQQPSRTIFAIPATASIMYILSLAHWAISLECFTQVADQANAESLGSLPDTYDELNGLDLALVAILSFNAVMSDAIVLWRMYVVWNSARPVMALSAALLVTTLGLNIANIVGSARNSYYDENYGQPQDTEIVATYGSNTIGLAAAFISLTSNLCATTLVGVKVWLHRARYSQRTHPGNGRTLVERVMELLVDSGVVYTAIWLLYCISFFRSITTQYVFSVIQEEPYPRVTAASHLDAAMAQITTIYPLVVFILIALDKLHHSRGPRILRDSDWPKERPPAVTVTLQVDVERNTGSNPVHPMAALSYTDTVNDTKLSGSETP